MEGLLHTHSGLRWIVLILMIATIFKAVSNRKSTSFSGMDRKLALFTLIFTHIQLVIGIVLYFLSPKVVFSMSSLSDPVLRFYLIEHQVGMLVAIALVTIGYSKMKKSELATAKYGKLIVYYSLALILTLISIPWPFLEYSGGWF